MGVLSTPLPHSDPWDLVLPVPETLAGKAGGPHLLRGHAVNGPRLWSLLSGNGTLVSRVETGEEWLSWWRSWSPSSGGCGAAAHRQEGTSWAHRQEGTLWGQANLRVPLPCVTVLGQVQPPQPSKSVIIRGLVPSHSQGSPQDLQK